MGVPQAIALAAGDVSQLTLAVVAAASALAGVLLQALAGWLVERRAERREVRHWIRENRYQAAQQMVITMGRLIDCARSGTTDELQAALVAAQQHSIAVDFVVADPTRQELAHAFDQILKAVEDLEEADEGETSPAWDDLSDAVTDFRDILNRSLGFNQE